MDHARTEHLYPAAVLTRAASLAITNWAIHVHLGAWLGEREVAAAETHAASLAKEFASSSLQTALEVGHGAILVNQQPFDLVEHGLVRGVYRLMAIDFTRDDDTHRWPHLLHGANLHGRSLRAQQNL